MTRADFAAVVRDDRRKIMRLDEGVDLLPIFDAIEWRNVHKIDNVI